MDDTYKRWQDQPPTPIPEIVVRGGLGGRVGPGGHGVWAFNGGSVSAPGRGEGGNAASAPGQKGTASTDQIFQYTNPLQGDPALLTLPTEEELRSMTDDLLMQRYNTLSSINTISTYAAPFAGSLLGALFMPLRLKPAGGMVGTTLGIMGSSHISELVNLYENETLRRGLLAR